jgi:hypothetical protein
LLGHEKVVSKRQLLAYSVEKLGFAGILIQFDQQEQSNSLFLLSLDFTEMPDSPEKGVFQHNRPVAAMGIAENHTRRIVAFWVKAELKRASISELCSTAVGQRPNFKQLQPRRHPGHSVTLL